MKEPGIPYAFSTKAHLWHHVRETALAKGIDRVTELKPMYRAEDSRNGELRTDSSSPLGTINKDVATPCNFASLNTL